MSFLHGLFGKRTPDPVPPAPAPDFNANPVAVAELMNVPGTPQVKAAAYGDPAFPAEYVRFCAQFCVRPGVTLMSAIQSDPRAADLEPLKRWLHPTTPEPEPKAIIRLGVAMLDRGLNIWEQPGINVFLHGRWDIGGGCTDESFEGLEMLAYLLNKPIKLLYKQQEDAEGYRVVDFMPGA